MENYATWRGYVIIRATAVEQLPYIEVDDTFRFVLSRVQFFVWPLAYIRYFGRGRSAGLGREKRGFPGSWNFLNKSQRRVKNSPLSADYSSLTAG